MSQIRYDDGSWSRSVEVGFVPPPSEAVARPCSRCGRPAEVSTSKGEDRCGLHIEAEDAA